MMVGHATSDLGRCGGRIVADTKGMTPRARQVMVLAAEEARLRGATAVAPEHVLVALALEGAGIAGHVLRDLGASAERISQTLPSAAQAAASETEPLPWAAGTEEAVARAHAEMLPLGHNYVGTEHLVLGVVEASDGAVPEVLARLGVPAEVVRRDVYDILGYYAPR
jgi:ATP-dependent Clp protease ATP-binding subunit ClpC